ncbi:MAG: hypothetical protein KAS30_04800 [Candidatus Diapherotrites archaeon]|nr:hypothetical protein [Candidatus Diapherotrites archaeon]
MTKKTKNLEEDNISKKSVDSKKEETKIVSEEKVSDNKEVSKNSDSNELNDSPDKPIENKKKSAMDKEEDFLFKILVAAFIVVLLFLVYSVATEKPVYFSQLYFNEETVPSEVDVNSSFSFSFVIENHEEEAFQYSYLLMINGETSDQLTYTVPDVVQKEDKIERTLSLTLGPSDEPVKVGIKVPTPSSDEPLDIHFWVDVKE